MTYGILKNYKNEFSSIKAAYYMYNLPNLSCLIMFHYIIAQFLLDKVSKITRTVIYMTYGISKYLLNEVFFIQCLQHNLPNPNSLMISTSTKYTFLFALLNIVQIV